MVNREMCDLFRVLCGLGWSGSPVEVESVCRRMYESYNWNFSAAVAQHWGEKYFEGRRNSLKEAVEKDSALFLRLDYDLEKVAAHKQQLLARDRISVARVRSVGSRALEGFNGTVSERSAFIADLSILETFASEGVEIMVDSSFQPNNFSGSLSKSYREATLAVNAMLLDVWSSGLAAILSKDAITKVVGLHLQKNGWAPKRKKEKGRNVGDCSSVSSRIGPQTPLNTEEVKVLTAQRWGQIVHPTIEDIARMILAAELKYGRESLVVWKMDLSGAYTLLNIMTSCVRLLGFVLESGDVFIYFAGIFGWTGMPAAFQVVTRVLRVCLSIVVSGGLLMYVDDVIACSAIDDWVQDREKAGDVISDLLGKCAEAKEKRESTLSSADRSIVCLGWEIRLTDWRIDVAEDNRLKALYVFWTVNVEDSLDLEMIERLSSLAQRYSLVYRELGVLMGSLYSMLGGKGKVSRFHKRKLSEEAKETIMLWKAYLVLSELEKARGQPRGRPIESFRQRDTTWVVEFDGSLVGIGFRVFSLNGNGEEILMAFGGEILNFDLKGRSEFQNAMEMAALAGGLCVAVGLGARGGSVKLRGDSVTVLEWSQHGTFKSQRSVGAAMALVAICEKYDVLISRETQHITSEENHVCDALSRGKEPEAQPNGGMRIIGKEGGRLKRLVALMNPLRGLKGLDFVYSWKEIRMAISDDLIGL